MRFPVLPRGIQLYPILTGSVSAHVGEGILEDVLRLIIQFLAGDCEVTQGTLEYTFLEIAEVRVIFQTWLSFTRLAIYPQFTIAVVVVTTSKQKSLQTHGDGIPG